MTNFVGHVFSGVKDRLFRETPALAGLAPAAAVLLAACGSGGSPLPSQSTDPDQQGRSVRQLPDLQEESPPSPRAVPPQTARRSPPPDEAPAATNRDAPPQAVLAPAQVLPQQEQDPQAVTPTTTVRASVASAKTSSDPLPAAVPAATYEGTGASSAKRVAVDFDTDKLFVLLGLDDILPFYDPGFVSASSNPLEDEDLVLGLALNGEAKAYSVGVLDRREMVNDTVGGVPVLVTW